MKSRDITLLSTADWDNPFWTNKQHVAVELAKLGHRVLYVESVGLRRPTMASADRGRVLRRLRRALVPPRRVRERIWVWSPLVLPWHQYAAVRVVNRIFFSGMLACWRLLLGMRRDWLWTYNPMTLRLARTGDYGKLIYHCVDEIAAQPGMPSEAIRSSEADLCRTADIVFVTAANLLETRRLLNRNTHYFPNVADFEHFARARSPETHVPEDIEAIPRPRLLFIGAISGYKVDFDLLRAMAEARPGWSIVLIGQVGEGEPGTRVEGLERLPNVHLLGPRPYDALPAYLKGCDVALLPSRLNEYTRNMFPMKFFEYLAAGKPVVATRLPSLESFSSCVRLSDDQTAFIDAVEQALTAVDEEVQGRIALAEKYTYGRRTRDMLALLEDGDGRATAAGAGG